MSPVPTLALRLLRREWRAGELKVLAAALVIAVAGVCGVGFFTDRMSRAMESGATELLGADLVVYSRTPIARDVDAEAARRGLDSARTVTFRSVVLAGERLQLARPAAGGRGAVRRRPSGQRHSRPRRGLGGRPPGQPAGGGDGR